jgi:hypothetical protein
MSPCPSTPHWDLSHVIAGAGAGSPVKSRDRAAKSWGRSDRGGRGGVCVFETPPPLRVFSSGLRSEACLFRSFLMVPLQTEPPLLPPKSQKRIYQRFFPWIPGENDVPGSSGRPGVAAQLQAQSPAPVLFFRQPHPRQASRPPPACPPPRRPGACDVAGFRWRGRAGCFFSHLGKKAWGPTDCSNSRLAAWLCACHLARTELHRVLIAVARRFTAEPRLEGNSRAAEPPDNLRFFEAGGRSISVQVSRVCCPLRSQLPATWVS